jgi:hypothetical protein
MIVFIFQDIVLRSILTHYNGVGYCFGHRVGVSRRFNDVIKAS